jgi:CheY-like chemotaxis protein
VSLVRAETDAPRLCGWHWLFHKRVAQPRQTTGLREIPGNSIGQVGLRWSDWKLPGTIHVAVIALLEDDASVLDAVALAIEANGWTARPYSDGAALLEDCRQRMDCDCLVLDPHLSGISSIAVMRAMVGNQVPVVVLTAHPNSAVTRTIVALGARAVMVKPVSESRLLETVRASLIPGPG